MRLPAQQNASAAAGEPIPAADQGRASPPEERPNRALPLRGRRGGLIACVGAETIEFHGWGSRVPEIERPDRIAFDLDPDEGLSFEEVKRTAREFREHLLSIGLESFPLLTGGKGIHVIVPITPDAEWPRVRDFAEAFCMILAQADPDGLTVDVRKQKRRGRIFLDYLRNQRTATAIMPYSIRARPGAPVAAPIAWLELDEIESPRQFTATSSKLLKRRARSTRLKDSGLTEQWLPL
jgi:bifunctional non-homologous end joining protein LigD